MDVLLDHLTAALAEPLALLTDPQARVYWPFLLGFFAVGGLVLAVRARSARAGLGSLLSRRVWLHRSALMDVRLMFVKSLIRVVAFAPIAVSALGVAVWVVHTLTDWLGPAAPSAMPRWQITALYTVTLFVAWDGSRYLVHMAMHKVPALWELHKVHHSAEVLTPFTVYRVHPIESFLYSLRGALVTGVITGAFFYAFRDRAVQYELLGVNAIGLALNALGANLRHSHVWLSYGSAIERVLISPAQHQLHHSADPKDFDCNYGAFLAVWDSLGGSLRLAGPRRALRLGLDESEANHDPASATSAVVGPLAACARRLLGDDEHEANGMANANSVHDGGGAPRAQLR